MLRSMVGMGGTEIIVILIVALLFLGPDKLPQAAVEFERMLSKWRQQPLREVDLETIPGANVIDDFANSGNKTSLREVGRHIVDEWQRCSRPSYCS